MMTFARHKQQSEQFTAFNEKRGGEWVDNFAVWAASKDFDLYDYVAIKTLVLEALTSRGVAPAEMEDVA
jgi:hypothetical protein